MDIILRISLVLAVGMIGGKLANRLKLPNVSGYLLIGVLLGPSFINLVSKQDAIALDIVNQLALAFIAFSIGSEFVIKDMISYGKQIMIITILEVIGAIGVVFFVMYVLFGQSLPMSLVIASMSAATAPAATLLVIRQYRMYGPVTKTILPVVALDDIFGIVAFGIALSIAKVLTLGTTLTFRSIVVGPFMEIIGSLVLGLLIGLALSFVLKKIKAMDDFQVMALIAIGLGVGLTTLFNTSSMGQYFTLSPLLTNIMIGTTLVNVYKKPEKVFRSVNNFVPAFYVLFFTLAGATLDLGILKTVGVIGIAYVFARGIGKFLGAWAGGLASKSEKNVVKYLGLCLLPQGGVSIGLSVIVRQQLPDLAPSITTIIMFGILVYETTGPIFSKIALTKAGEVNGLDRLHGGTMITDEDSDSFDEDTPSPTKLKGSES